MNLVIYEVSKDEISNFVKIIVMRLLGFGSRVKPNKFLYIPQHYDEKQERLDALLDEADASDEGGVASAKARIKHSLSYRPYYYDKHSTAKSSRKKANIRTLIIIFCLILLFFFFLQLYSEDLTNYVK